MYVAGGRSAWKTVQCTVFSVGRAEAPGRQQNVASHINFRPKNERFRHLLMPKTPFFKKLMDRMKGRVTGLSFECVGMVGI